MAKRAQYPSISLRDAITRVKAIYEAEGTNNMPNEVAVTHMGYSGLSGTSMSVLAALKKYNLLEGRGNDIHVTHDTVVIISDETAENQSERAEALSNALSADPLFQELLERFGSKTTELNVASYLKKRGFNPNPAEAAAVSFLNSVRFVDEQIGEYNSISPTKSESHDMPEPIQKLGAKGAIVAPIVISGVKTWPQIVVPQPFTEKNWVDMVDLLTLMKPGFITITSSESTNNETVSLDDDETDNS